MEELKGRVAVVTGGASGIGAGIARACAEQGMRVVLADIELAPAERLARELEAPVTPARAGGSLSGPGLGMYSTPKFGVVAYSESLAQELAPHGIGVSVLCPGWTNPTLGDASRNRPAALGRAPDNLGIITPGMAEGM